MWHRPVVAIRRGIYRPGEIPGVGARAVIDAEGEDSIGEREGRSDDGAVELVENSVTVLVAVSSIE